MERSQELEDLVREWFRAASTADATVVDRRVSQAPGARLIGSDMAKDIVLAFLNTQFAGGRHQRRVDQLSHLLQDSD